MVVDFEKIESLRRSLERFYYKNLSATLRFKSAGIALFALVLLWVVLLLMAYFQKPYDENRMLSLLMLCIAGQTVEILLFNWVMNKKYNCAIALDNNKFGAWNNRKMLYRDAMVFAESAVANIQPYELQLVIIEQKGQLGNRESMLAAFSAVEQWLPLIWSVAALLWGYILRNESHDFVGAVSLPFYVYSYFLIVAVPTFIKQAITIFATFEAQRYIGVLEIVEVMFKNNLRNKIGTNETLEVGKGSESNKGVETCGERVRRVRKHVVYINRTIGYILRLFQQLEFVKKYYGLVSSITRKHGIWIIGVAVAGLFSITFKSNYANDVNVLLYLLSSLLQVNAAIVALACIFVVYQLQRHDAAIHSLRNDIYNTEILKFRKSYPEREVDEILEGFLKRFEKANIKDKQLILQARIDKKANLYSEHLQEWITRCEETETSKNNVIDSMLKTCIWIIILMFALLKTYCVAEVQYMQCIIVIICLGEVYILNDVVRTIKKCLNADY